MVIINLNLSLVSQHYILYSNLFTRITKSDFFHRFDKTISEAIAFSDVPHRILDLLGCRRVLAFLG